MYTKRIKKVYSRIVNSCRRKPIFLYLSVNGEHYSRYFKKKKIFLSILHCST